MLERERVLLLHPDVESCEDIKEGVCCFIGTRMKKSIQVCWRVRRQAEARVKSVEDSR